MESGTKKSMYEIAKYIGITGDQMSRLLGIMNECQIEILAHHSSDDAPFPLVATAVEQEPVAWMVVSSRHGYTSVYGDEGLAVEDEHNEKIAGAKTTEIIPLYSNPSAQPKTACGFGGPPVAIGACIKIDHGSISLKCDPVTIQKFVDRMIAAKFTRALENPLDDSEIECYFDQLIAKFGNYFGEKNPDAIMEIGRLCAQAKAYNALSHPSPPADKQAAQDIFEKCARICDRVDFEHTNNHAAAIRAEALKVSAAAKERG